MPTAKHNEKQAEEVLDGLLDLEMCDDPNEVAYILGIKYRPYDPENIQQLPGHDYNTSYRVNQGLPRTNNNYNSKNNEKKNNDENEYKNFCYSFCFFIIVIWILSLIF